MVEIKNQDMPQEGGDNSDNTQNDEGTTPNEGGEQGGDNNEETPAEEGTEGQM